MQNTVFMISDASYSSQTQVAGLGIVDTHTQKSYKISKADISDPKEAEFYALIYSVKIAMEKKYDNVVFVYDCKQLDLQELQKYANKKFKSAQFLWLKRVYVDEADRLAKKARTLYEKLPLKVLPLKNEKQPIKIDKSEKLRGEKLIKFFKSFDTKQILYACTHFGTHRECEILYGYINGSKVDIYDSDGIIGLGRKKRTYMKFVYQMLSTDEQKNFFKYLKYLDPRIQNTTFPGKLKMDQKTRYINEILKSLKTSSKEN